jgi:hypothetical protein
VTHDVEHTSKKGERRVPLPSRRLPHHRLPPARPGLAGRSYALPLLAIEHRLVRAHRIDVRLIRDRYANLRIGLYAANSRVADGLVSRLPLAVGHVPFLLAVTRDRRRSGFELPLGRLTGEILLGRVTSQTRPNRPLATESTAVVRRLNEAHVVGLRQRGESSKEGKECSIAKPSGLVRMPAGILPGAGSQLT